MLKRAVLFQILNRSDPHFSSYTYHSRKQAKLFAACGLHRSRRTAAVKSTSPLLHRGIVYGANRLPKLGHSGSCGSKLPHQGRKRQLLVGSLQPE